MADRSGLKSHLRDSSRIWFVACLFSKKFFWDLTGRAFSRLERASADDKSELPERVVGIFTYRVYIQSEAQSVSSS
jgi:hypothetical protein